MSLANLPEQFAPLERTLPKMLMRQAERYGDRRLVTISGKTLTHAGTLAAAAGYAGALAQAGVKAGDRVAIMCGNRVELLLTILGCGWLGAVAVPINTASRGAQLEHILGNCGARLMVIECGLTPVLVSLARERIALEALWLVGDGEGPDLPHLKSGPFPATGERPSTASRRTERYAGDPLHVRHYRPVEGRVLPARPIFLVGLLCGAPARGRRGRRPDDDAADVPYQCAHQFLSGAAARRDAHRRTAIFGVRIHRVVWPSKKRRSLLCSAPWCRSS